LAYTTLDRLLAFFLYDICCFLKVWVLIVVVVVVVVAAAAAVAAMLLPGEVMATALLTAYL